MTTPTDLRERAARYRKMATEITNQAIVNAIKELADEYDQKAAEMEQEGAASDRPLRHGSSKGD